MAERVWRVVLEIVQDVGESDAPLLFEDDVRDMMDEAFRKCWFATVEVMEITKKS